MLLNACGLVSDLETISSVFIALSLRRTPESRKSLGHASGLRSGSRIESGMTDRGQRGRHAGTLQILGAGDESARFKHGDQAVQFDPGPFQIRVVTESGETGGIGHPWLVRIDFPRVKVEQVGAVKMHISSYRRCKSSQWHDPEVGTAPDWNLKVFTIPFSVAAWKAEAEIADGKFNQRSNGVDDGAIVHLGQCQPAISFIEPE